MNFKRLAAKAHIGAKYVGIFQSLIVTCKMHNLDPYTYYKESPITPNAKSSNSHPNSGNNISPTSLCTQISIS